MFRILCLYLHCKWPHAERRKQYYMINRQLIRINAVQLVYADLLNPGKDMKEVVKEMEASLEQANDLYHHMLNLICDITDYASQEYEVECARRRDRGIKSLPNDRFISNRFAVQLENNDELTAFTLSHKDLRWTSHDDVVHNLYDEIRASAEYEAYMNAPATSYDEDRELWRTLYKKFIVDNDAVDEALEERSIYWNCDRPIIDTFVLKTIRHFQEANGDEQPLQPEYSNADDSAFARNLVVKTVYEKEEEVRLIRTHTHNWDYSRLAKMDVAIMMTAICEILHFPDISVSVSLNEYINIAKMYSAIKSIGFINGALDSIVSDLRKQGRIMK